MIQFVYTHLAGKRELKDCGSIMFALHFGIIIVGSHKRPLTNCPSSQA